MVAWAERWDPAGRKRFSCRARARMEAGKTRRGRADARPLGDRALLTDTELVDDRAVPLHIGLLEVVKKPAAASDELQQTATGMMVLRMGLEMLGEVGNAVREKCDLHFWRPGIAVMDAILVDDGGFLLLRGRQNPILLSTFEPMPEYTRRFGTRHHNSGRG